MENILLIYFLSIAGLAFDDGIYAAARFLELMDKNNMSADEIINDLPASSVNTPEIFIAVPEQEKFKLISSFSSLVFNIDGVRGECPRWPSCIF